MAVKEKKKGPIIKHTAVYPGLVDLVKDDAGSIVFLMAGEEGLDAFPELIDDPAIKWVPPPEESICWELPRLKDVLYQVENDTDLKLYHDLISYHLNISELPSEDYYHLLTIWDFHTYIFQRFQYSPYLWLYAIPERGKTRTGKGCTYVAWRGLHTESLRDSYLVRASEELQPSLFMDVLELTKKAQQSGSEDILLQRFEAGARVPRVNHPERGAHKHTTWYSVFGPTIVATNEQVSEILATRALQINMPESDKDFPDDVLPFHGLPYRERLVAFRARNMRTFLPRADKPCRGRLGDILRPLRQIVTMVAPDEEDRFLDLCRVFQRQRHEVLEDSLEGQILQAFFDLEDNIIGGRIPSNEVADQINKNVPERWHRKPGTITRCAKRMGFKTPRSHGETVIDIDLGLLKKLVGRYLGNSALSALSANDEEKQRVGGCTFGCRKNEAEKVHPDSGGTGAEGALNENDEKKVHPVSGENFNLFAEGAESAENQRVCPITGATPNAGACSYHTRNESGLCGECPIGVADRFGGRTG